MARPKSKVKKQQVNLSLDKEKLVKGKRTANFLKKSLSQFTEDMYVDIHDNFFGLGKDPKERIKQIEQQVKELSKVIIKMGEKDKT